MHNSIKNDRRAQDETPDNNRIRDRWLAVGFLALFWTLIVFLARVIS